MESPLTPVTFHTPLYHRISCFILELYAFYASVLAPLTILETLMQKNICWMKEVLQLQLSKLQNISVSSVTHFSFLHFSFPSKWVFSPYYSLSPWRRKWQPTPVCLPGKSHGQRSLVGYSLWGHKNQTQPLTKPPPPPWFSIYLSYVLWLYTLYLSFLLHL